MTREIAVLGRNRRRSLGIYSKARVIEMAGNGALHFSARALGDGIVSSGAFWAIQYLGWERGKVEN